MIFLPVERYVALGEKFISTFSVSTSKVVRSQLWGLFVLYDLFLRFERFELFTLLFLLVWLLIVTEDFLTAADLVSFGAYSMNFLYSASSVSETEKNKKTD